MIDQSIDTDNEIDPNIYNKFISAMVILDNTANGSRNISTVKKMITDHSKRTADTGHPNLLLKSGEY